MEDFPSKKHRRPQLDLNVVPILDMLVSIIFFLLLTVTFVGYSKMTLPPSSVSTITDVKSKPPLNPKLLAGINGTNLILLLNWEGENPGYKIKKMTIQNTDEFRKEIISVVSGMLDNLIKQNEGVSSLQIGLTSSTDYQTMIAVMDGALTHIKDHVLISYLEAESLIASLGR